MAAVKATGEMLNGGDGAQKMFKIENVSTHNLTLERELLLRRFRRLKSVIL